MRKSNKKSSSTKSSFLRLKKIGTRFLENIVAGKGKKQNGEDISEDQILAGTDGDDKLTGGSGDDRIWGKDGNDKLRGGSGDDKVWEAKEMIKHAVDPEMMKQVGPEMIKYL